MPASVNQPNSDIPEYLSRYFAEKPEDRMTFDQSTVGWLAEAGVAPQAGTRLTTTSGAPPVPEGGYGGNSNGFWAYQGGKMMKSGGPDAAGSDPYAQSEYVWIDQGPTKAAPAAAAPVERVADAKPDEARPTIYDSFDSYIDIARAEDQGRNRMPFVFGGGYGEGQPTYQDVPYDPILALEQVYPSGRNAFRNDLTDPMTGDQLTPYGQGGGMGGGMMPTMTGNRNKEPVDPTMRSGYYENYGAPGYTGVPVGGYGGVPAPAQFGTTYPGTGTGYAAQDVLPTYRARR